MTNFLNLTQLDGSDINVNFDKVTTFCKKQLSKQEADNLGLDSGFVTRINILESGSLEVWETEKEIYTLLGSKY